jgi:radical SAM superfamily enzyme YgiQ (UPF0313 family)
VADDDELLDLLAESGCRQILVGLESFNGEDLVGIDPSGWKHKHSDRYLEAIERIQSYGVTVNGCFILGLDNHTPEVFSRLKEFIDRSGLLEVQITVMTPFAGTPLYERMRRQGVLLQERFWDRCTLFDVNYKPRRMTVDELEAGMRWLFGEIYNEREYTRRQRQYMEIVKKRL